MTMMDKRKIRQEIHTAYLLRGVLLLIALSVIFNLYVDVYYIIVIGEDINVNKEDNIILRLRPPMPTTSQMQGKTKTKSNVQLQKISKTSKEPDGWRWSKMNYQDIRAHFRCNQHSDNRMKRLPTKDDWQYFRDQYRKVVDRDAVFDDVVPPTKGYSLYDDGKPPPYFAGRGTTRGRGLFASRDIKRGELVHDGSKSDITFPNAMSWRRYVFSLPKRKACDMIDWSWTMKTTKNGKYKIFSAINISILLNSGNSDDEVNINPESETSSKFYSLRDIMKGEELLTDYDMYDTVWSAAGLGDDDNNMGDDDGIIDDDGEDA